MADSEPAGDKPNLSALDMRATRKRTQIERAEEIKREAARREIDEAIPLKAGRITGGVFACTALAVIAIAGLAGRIPVVVALQAGLAAMALFFAIGWFLGHVGHQLVGEYTASRIARETEEMLGPFPQPEPQEQEAP